MAGLLFVPSADAATLSVCASGCSHATLSDAFAAASDGDTIQVDGGGAGAYVPSSEAYSLSMSAVSTTVTCINGATIGQTDPTGANTIFFTTSSTFSGCAFSNIDLRPAGDVSGFIITNNTFSSAATSTILLNNGVANYTISNNTNLNWIDVRTTSTNGLIEGNTFYGSRVIADQGMYLMMSVSSTNTTIRGNTIYSRATSTPSGSARAVVLRGEDLTFASNTIVMVNQPPSAMTATLAVYVSGTVSIVGNRIETPLRDPADVSNCVAVSISPNADVAWRQSLLLANNTIRGRCDAAVVAMVSDGGFASGKRIDAMISKNIFYSGGSSQIALQFSRGGFERHQRDER